MSAPDTHRQMQFDELNRLNDALGTMRRWGISEAAGPFQELQRARGAVMGKLGLRLPRATTLLQTLAGLSPGVIRLWLDAEIGWKVEARRTPESPPVYRLVSDDVARALLTSELTHELEEQLMTPDEYIGE